MTSLETQRSLASLLVAVVLALVGCKEEQEKREIIRPVRAMKVADPQAFEERWFPGRAKATQEANIAFEVSGTSAPRTPEDRPPSSPAARRRCGDR